MGWFSKLIYGVDLDEEQTRGNDLDAALRQANQRDYAPGGVIYERIEAERGTAAANQAYGTVQEHLEASQTGDVNAQVTDAFGEGLKEGYDNVTSGISKTLAAPFKFAWASIPWQVWLVGAVVLFLYMGGGVFLKGLISRKFK